MKDINHEIARVYFSWSVFACLYTDHGFDRKMEIPNKVIVAISLFVFCLFVCWERSLRRSVRRRRKDRETKRKKKRIIPLQFAP